MAAQETKRGAFIVLEGLDRSGKTTQVQRLEQRFQAEGKKVEAIRFPDRTTTIGKMIDSYLKSSVGMEDHAIHLLFSANRWEAAEKIKATLASGTSIVCDRYYHSGAVYSTAKQNPSLPLSWARAPDTGLPRPDVVVFLDLDEEEAKRRGGWGDERYEKAEMQRNVKDLFLKLRSGQNNDGWKKGDSDGLAVVDAGGSVDDVADKVWAAVSSALETLPDEIGSLA